MASLRRGEHLLGEGVGIMRDKSSNAVRIRGIGAGGRMLTLPIGFLTLALVVLQLSTGELAGPANVTCAVAAVLLALFLAGRSLTSGLVIGSSETIVRSWFISRRFSTKDVVSVGVAPYSGLLNDADLDGSSRYLKVIEFQRDAEGIRKSSAFRGSVGFTRNVTRRAARAEEALQAFQKK